MTIGNVNSAKSSLNTTSQTKDLQDSIALFKKSPTSTNLEELLTKYGSTINQPSNTMIKAQLIGLLKDNLPTGTSINSLINGSEKLKGLLESTLAIGDEKIKELNQQHESIKISEANNKEINTETQNLTNKKVDPNNLEEIKRTVDEHSDSRTPPTKGINRLRAILSFATDPKKASESLLLDVNKKISEHGSTPPASLLIQKALLLATLGRKEESRQVLNQIQHTSEGLAAIKDFRNAVAESKLISSLDKNDLLSFTDNLIKTTTQELEKKNQSLMLLGMGLQVPITKDSTEESAKAIQKSFTAFDKLHESIQEIRFQSSKIAEMVRENRIEMNKADKKELAKYVEEKKQQTIKLAKDTDKKIEAQKIELSKKAASLQREKAEITEQIKNAAADKSVNVDQLKQRLVQIPAEQQQVVAALISLKQFSESIKSQLKILEQGLIGAAKNQSPQKAQDSIMTFIDFLKNPASLPKLGSGIAASINLKTLLPDLENSSKDIQEILKTIGSDELDISKVNLDVKASNNPDKVKKKLTPQESEELKKEVIKRVTDAISSNSNLLSGAFTISRLYKELGDQVEKAVKSIMAGKGINLNSAQVTRMTNKITQDITKSFIENSQNFFGQAIGNLSDTVNNFAKDPLNQGIFTDGTLNKPQKTA